MALSTVDFDSRSDAITAAEHAGYDESSVRVTCDHESGRYQWDLRDFGGYGAADGEAPSGADAAADVVAEMVAEFADAEITGESDVILTDIVIPLGWGSVDGGAHTADEAVDGGEGAASVDGPVVNEPVASGACADGQRIMQIFGAMDASVLMQFAQSFADKHMQIVTLRDAVTYAVTDVITPQSGKGRKSSGGSVTRSASVARVAAERAETIIDRIKRGVWLDSEVPESNRSILNLKHQIERASASGDMDLLASLGSFKSTSTYYNQARAYLEYFIAVTPARQAALDAEYGFGASIAA